MSKIVSNTPLRISFVGGMTDIPWFYREYGGAVINTTIDKYITVEVKQCEDDRIVVGKNILKPPYTIIRAAKRIAHIGDNIEIKIDSDVLPGSGLGGSSALAVGLLNALWKYAGVEKHQEIVARAACQIEIDMLGAPIGKQDQYIAAYGGVRRFTFEPDETVVVERIFPPAELESHLMLFNTGICRDTNRILEKQKEDADPAVLLKMKAQVKDFTQAMLTSDFRAMGHILHDAWCLKRSLTSIISSVHLDAIYRYAFDAGAFGGKLLGAGGGGHFLFVIAPEDQQAVIDVLDGLATHVPFAFEPHGSHLL